MTNTNQVADESREILPFPLGQEPTGEQTPVLEAHSRFAGLKKVVGRVAAFGALAAIGGGSFGAVHYSDAPTTLGPHKATVRMTTDSNLTLGLGPFCKIVKPLDHSPMGEGAYIDVGGLHLIQV